jgi:hypothetical protein
MQCRNCENYSDSEFRYCPRCGAPSSLGWPLAGAPWLRRPAAIAGLAVLVIAWLFALQRALWLPARTPDRGSPLASVPQQMPADKPDLRHVQARPESTSPTRKTVRHRAPAKALSMASTKPAPKKRAAARPTRLAVGGSVDEPVVARPQWRVKTRRITSKPITSGAPRSLPKATRPQRTLLADASDAATPPVRIVPRRESPARARAARAPSRRERARVRSWREDSSRPRSVVWSSPNPRANTQAPLVPARFEPRPPPPDVARSTRLVVHVTAQPAGPRTYVYYNGGRGLGLTPLRIRFDRPGAHRLVFWTPSLGRLVKRSIHVSGRGPQRLAVRMGSARQIARAR